ncbi:Receptor-like protein 12, partial [Mucuna pruriens]
MSTTMAPSKLKLENPNLQMLVQNLTSIRRLYLDGVSISTMGQKWCNALLSLCSLEELSLSRCNLSGPIESSLGGLKQLVVIHLNQNNLSGPVPEMLVKLSNLASLQLSDCGLSGRFPEQIFQLRSLTMVDISHNNDLHGSLQDFPLNGSLRSFTLSNTSFSGTLPDSVSNLRQLLRLDLSTCQFNGMLPSSLAELTELSYLNLSSNTFTGPLPPFHVFKKLSQLDLSHNNFSESIPSTHFEGLLNLVEIYLQNNSFSGVIPSSLFALPLVQTIRLSYNHFEGQLDGFPNSSSSIVNSLDLSHNNLEGPIPILVFHLNKLSILRLSSNNLSGTIHLDVIWKLESLTTLDLSHNNFLVDVNVKDAHPNMTHLMLASCKLTEFPSFLSKQSRLSYLDLSTNQIQGIIPHWIWSLQFLTHLDLSHNLLTKLEEPMLKPSDNLFMLDLHSSRLHGSLPTFPKHATYLDFSRNNFSSSIPLDIGDQLSATIYLSLSHNGFYGQIPDSMCKASKLQVLELSSNKFEGTIPTLGVLILRKNKITGSIPDTFPLSCALRTLDVKENQLDGQIPKTLANCMALEVLDLGSNQIIDAFPCLLKNISTLRVLVVRTNRFHGPIGCPKTKGTWKMLQIVDLAFNNFSGMLPGKIFRTWEKMMSEENPTASEVNRVRFKVGGFNGLYYQDAVSVTYKGRQLRLVKLLTLFTSMDFSNNHFEGPIPEELMNFKALHVLNLSKNALSGEIPSSIGNLKNLESLDLSENYLRGKIPTELATLSSLSVLNLSFNHLVGMIPTGTQLQSLDPSCFEGNGGLYGPPLTKISGNQWHGIPSPPTGSGRSLAIVWNILSVELGLVFGLAIVIGPLLYWKQWRLWYWRCVDNILCCIFPKLLHLESESRGGQTYTILSLSSNHCDDL